MTQDTINSYNINSDHNNIINRFLKFNRTSHNSQKPETSEEAEVAPPDSPQSSVVEVVILRRLLIVVIILLEMQHPGYLRVFINREQSFWLPWEECT